MSQVTPPAIALELADVLTVTPVHNAMIYLVKKHGPTDFPEHMDAFLSCLGMLNPNVPWDKYSLFGQMLGLAVRDNEVLSNWYGENHIYSTIVNHHTRVNRLQAEVNNVLFPQIQSPTADIKIG